MVVKGKHTLVPTIMETGRRVLENCSSLERHPVHFQDCWNQGQSLDPLQTSLLPKHSAGVSQPFSCMFPFQLFSPFLGAWCILHRTWSASQTGFQLFPMFCKGREGAGSLNSLLQVYPSIYRNTKQGRKEECLGFHGWNTPGINFLLCQGLWSNLYNVNIGLQTGFHWAEIDNQLCVYVCVKKNKKK